MVIRRMKSIYPYLIAACLAVTILSQAARADIFTYRDDLNGNSVQIEYDNGIAINIIPDGRTRIPLEYRNGGGHIAKKDGKKAIVTIRDNKVSVQKGISDLPEGIFTLVTLTPLQACHNRCNDSAKDIKDSKRQEFLTQCIRLCDEAHQNSSAEPADFHLLFE